MEIQKEWCKEEFTGREVSLSHGTFDKEFIFYEAVKQGNLEFVKKNCEKNAFASSVEMGVLSKNPLNNIKYHFIITAAMITRFCVEGGMELERAYRLSDFFITKMDQCKTIEEVIDLHHVMVLDYTEKMKIMYKQAIISKSISQCIDYIYNHLHKRITLKELAEYTKLSESYLSKLFKQEIKSSVSEYIRQKKVEEAQNLLQHTEYKIVDIANYLAFSSQSYFIQAFLKETGLTPKRYRDIYYRTIRKQK